MRRSAVWAAWLCWSAVGMPAAVAAQDTGPMQVAVGPRFWASARGSAGASARRWIDASRQPVLLRRISVDLRGVPLGAALRDIGERAGLRITYSPNVLPAGRSISLVAETITVGAALGALLYGVGVDVLLASGSQAVIVGQGQIRLPTGGILGQVTNAKTGEKLSRVEVFLDGTPWRTVTDSAGRYSLTDVEVGSYTLVARLLGYAKQSRKVTIRSERNDTMDIALDPVAVSLDELVATATGQQRRRDLGNAITTIQADSVLQHAPVRSLSELLENRVPGLTAQRTSGAPGDPMRLRLRGLNSALRSNDPVVVVDGVRVYAAQAEARSGNLTNACTYMNGNQCSSTGSILPAPSPLDQIDPNTIEKIEVFKGASAATLYGADAANGVIVITTKRGKPGPTRWTASLTHGRSVSPGRYPAGYYRWGRDLFYSTPRFCTLTDLTCVPDSLVQFQALNDPSLTPLGHGRETALSLTASGGTQALTYSVTGSYNDQRGLLALPANEVARFQDSFQRAAPDWMRRPHRYEYWSVASNVTARLSAVADLTLLTSIARSEQQRSNLEQQLSVLQGTYVDTVNGLYYRPNPPVGGGAADQYTLNTTPAILEGYYTRATASTLTLTTGLNAQWRPRPWFTGTGQASLQITPRSDTRLVPTYIVTGNDSGSIARGSGRSLLSTVNLQGTLRKPLRHGFIFETNLGANVTTTYTSDVAGLATGLVPGTSGAGGAKHTSFIDATSSLSSFGWYVEPRVSGQRLSLSAGLRLDGGSANGARLSGTGAQPGSLFSLKNLLALPKLNGSWVISEEPWFPFSSLFSSLRLRGAYGQAQVQPGPADRLRLYTTRVELVTLGNTQLRPERSTEVEGGFDADLLDSRLSVELTAYRKLQVDALMNVTLPGSVKGGTTVVKNIGNILNRGVELALGVRPIQSSALTWSAQLLLSQNYNELTKLGRGVDPNYQEGLVAGYPVHGRFAKPIRGFIDQNGDGVIQLNEIQIGDSAVFVGRLYPAYTTALSSSLVLFGGAVGVTADLNYQADQTQVDQTAATNWVLARALVDPAAPANQQAAVIAYVAGDNNGGTSYGVIQRVSSFRFNNLSVNYRAPARLAKLLRAERLGIAVQGRNLALHSTYRGKDPNVNAWAPGEGIADTGQLPEPRTWQLRVDLAY